MYRHLDTRLCISVYKKKAGLLMLWRTEPQPEENNQCQEHKHIISSPIAATRGNFTRWQLQMMVRTNWKTLNTETSITETLFQRISLGRWDKISTIKEKIFLCSWLFGTMLCCNFQWAQKCPVSICYTRMYMRNGISGDTNLITAYVPKHFRFWFGLHEPAWWAQQER